MTFDTLPRREREIFEILVQAGEASSEEVRRRLSGCPSNSAVRALLGRMERRGVIAHKQIERSYVYFPTAKPGALRKSAIQQFSDVFFGGSKSRAAVALLRDADRLDDDEVDALKAIIRKARPKESD